MMLFCFPPSMVASLSIKVLNPATVTASIFIMTTLAQSPPLTPEDVDRASNRDGKLYELIDGELKEKTVGFESLVIATRISERLNAVFYPHTGVAAVEAMIYCFDRPNHGRKPDVVYVRMDRFPEKKIPKGDLYLAPDLVVEVLSPGNTGVEIEGKLDEYLEAGIAMVWIVNPDPRTIRIYRSDGTTRLFRATGVIENEALLPGFRLVAGEVFPVT
jgi:Uma2 family endonuclease